MPRAPSLMSIPEAADWLGLEKPHKARWLRRYLLNREQATGRALLVRVGRNPARPRYAVSVSTLRKHCPELVDPVDNIGRAMHALVVAQKRDREALLERLDDLEEGLAALAEAVRRLAS